MTTPRPNDHVVLIRLALADLTRTGGVILAPLPAGTTGRVMTSDELFAEGWRWRADVLPVVVTSPGDHYGFWAWINPHYVRVMDIVEEIGRLDT